MQDNDLSKAPKPRHHKPDSVRAGLRRRRETLRLSRKRVADDLDIDPSTLQRWELSPEEKKYTPISDAELERLVRYYELIEAGKPGLTVVPRSTSREPVSVRLFNRLLTQLKIRNAAGANEAELREIKTDIRLAGEALTARITDKSEGAVIVEAFIEEAIRESSAAPE